MKAIQPKKQGKANSKKSAIDFQLTKKVLHYEQLTKAALQKIKTKKKLSPVEQKNAADFLEMANNYFSDAKYFKAQGDLLTALAAFSYAHAWLDAGVRTGLFDHQNDGRLFVLPK